MMRSIFIIVSSSIFLFTYCKGKGGDKPSETKTSSAPEIRYIAPKAGLNMRDKPDTTGTLMVTIPQNEKVELLEETGNAVTISGATGKWSKIKWKDKTGWAFGGFLIAEKKSGTGNDASNLPPEIKKLLPALDEFTGTWIRLEYENNKYVAVTMGDRTPSMEITYTNSHYPDAPLIIINTIQETTLWWIDSVTKNDIGALFEARYYNSINKQPDGKPGLIELNYIKEKKIANISFKNGRYSGMTFVRESHSSEVQWRTAEPERRY